MARKHNGKQKKRAMPIEDSSDDEPLASKAAALQNPSPAASTTATTALPPTARPQVQMVPIDASVYKSPVLKKVNQLTQALASGGQLPTLAELNVFNVREVREMVPTEVSTEIESMVVGVVSSILRGEGFRYAVPSRTTANQIYVTELDRIVLADKLSVRDFTNMSALVHQLLAKGIHVTKRDLFYTDVKLFKDQSESDTILDDVACMVGCTRSSLHVVASEKGVVVGRIAFRDDGDLIDCTRMGVGGKAIPPYIDRLTDITYVRCVQCVSKRVDRSDAKFILLVEKDAAFMRLAEDRFYNKYPCIILTAKGQPDVATRMFLKRIQNELHLPVLGLVDSDPYVGLKILSVYMSGSKNMSYDSASLTCRDIKWLGVRPSDLTKYKIPDQCRLPMKETDIKTGKDMLEEEFIKKNPLWSKELELMLKSKEKAEIQALSTFGFQFLTQEYLPQKLRDGDWI
ncbi:hypothetical protein B5M09_000899 [Aphanomyces astaci]|uniref:DNA topoisomerase (ATP-hydrolyzing) n=1 Tax=Aphanomyces astaci TaxID=112090 RepID=A0A3R7WH33_APHAT|nr:hypothetical protein B5M09_000899 [Aphanomyces astaci]